jgi:hypothetical protein
MNHGTYTTPDACETQHTFRTLASQLDEAVAQANTARIQQLMCSRRQLAHTLGATNRPAQITTAQREELIRETHRWLATLQAHQQRISAEIARLHTRRNSQRTISRAYRPALPTTHGLRQRG